MHDDYIYQDRDELEFLILLQLKIFGMNNENLMQTVNSIEILEEKQQLTLNIIVSQMIYSCFVIKPNRSHIILNFIKEILVFEVNNKNKINFFDVLIQFLLEKYTQESNYLICKLIENNFLEPKIIENRKNLYFIHYKSEEEINELLKTKRFMGQIKENIEKLSKNDWELHKQLIKEGVNPNEIAKIIRNDELEKLQEISSQTNFDFNQIIEPSLYERCSFINKKNVTLIDYAAFFSAVKCFKYLLMNNANVNNTGKYAAASGNNEIIHLCEQNHSSFEGSLEAAIIFHQNDIFKYIYENKTIKIKSLEELGKKCILYHNYELFSYLINKKMKINNYIINETARFGNLFLVKYFRKFNQLPKNILVFSAQSGNIELVKYVLRQKRMNINFKDNFGKTALMYASEKGYSEIIKLLLTQREIDINFKNDEGMSSLLFASSKGYTSIIKLLIRNKGININDKDKDGNTALIYAVKNSYTEILKLLLSQKRFNINMKNNNGKTALIIGAKRGYKKLVKLLLDHKGIDINSKDKNEKTALIYASEKGYIEIVKLLLEQKGIDINTKDYLGNTPLMIASEKGYIEIVKVLLVQKEIDINANCYGKTASIYALEKGHTEIVELFSKQEEIDTNTKNQDS